MDTEAIAAALTAEQERIGADLHDTAGQLFVVLGMMLRRELEVMPDDTPLRGQLVRLADLADSGKWEIDQAVRGLTFLPTVRDGLVEAILARAAAIEADSGLQVSVRISGDATDLSLETVRGLYRVCNEALVNVWRHAAAATVTVELACGPEELVLRVSDDGRGVWAGGRGPGAGTAGMHRAVDDLGGRLRVRDAKGGGTLVEARVPRSAAEGDPAEVAELSA